MTRFEKFVLVAAIDELFRNDDGSGGLLSEEESAALQPIYDSEIKSQDPRKIGRKLEQMGRKYFDELRSGGDNEDA